MRKLFIVASAIFFHVASAQENEAKPAVAPSLNALAKISVTDTLTANPNLPPNYRWEKDARREQSVKRATIDKQYFDPGGLELPPDDFSTVKTEATYRTLKD